MTGVLIKSVRWDAHMLTGKTPCEHDSRDQGNASMSKEWQMLPVKHQNLEEKKIFGTNSPSQPSEDTNPVDTLSSDF